MTKRDLVIRIAKETGYKQQDVMEVIQQALDIIVDQLSTGQGLEFRNFGVFEVLVRKQRIGRNPNAPKKTVKIPERVVVKFKPGKVMRDRVSKVSIEQVRPAERDVE